MSLVLIAFLQPAHAQNISTEKSATLVLNFNSSEFNGYQGDSFTPSHDGSMYAYSTSIKDSKSGNWKASLWLYFLKNDTSRSLDLNSDASQISGIRFSPDDKKLLFVGNGCDDNTSHTTFFVFNLQDIHLKCNGLTNVPSADWMPGGSVVFLQNNEENDTVSIYQNGTQKLLYAKQITPPYVSLNSSHIEFIKASPDGKKVALWYFVMLGHKTQILDVDNGKITDTFDGGHPRWSHDGNMLLYTNPVSTGYYDKGPRAVITYINLLDINKNKTSTIDSVPVGVDDLFLSANGSKAFYVTKVPSPYEFLNFTSGMYEIDLNNVVNNTMQQHSLTDAKSPLKQFKSGIKADDVQCNTNLVLIFKLEDGTPACVKLESGFKLVQWGWARPISQSEYESKYRFDAYPTIDYQNNLLGIQNRTYDFMILNDTMTSYHSPPLKMTFHGIVFTLLPSPWYGGPPGSCGGYELRTDAKFDDGSHEQIGTFVQGQPCSDNYTQTNLSIHTNPQVGVSVLHQSVMLLVSSATQTAVQFLHLSLSTNSSYIQYGHAIGIDISLNNTSSDTVTIGAASNPPRDDLSTGPCDNVPFGITILQGFYTQDNMTGTASIPLFPTPPCPLVPSPKSFTFQPLSSQASMECAGMFSCTGSVTMERHLSISGSLQYNIQGPFSPGIYTIVGGDEWGHTVIRHFTVTNSTGS